MKVFFSFLPFLILTITSIALGDTVQGVTRNDDRPYKCHSTNPVLRFAISFKSLELKSRVIANLLPYLTHDPRAMGIYEVVSAKYNPPQDTVEYQLTFKGYLPGPQTKVTSYPHEIVLYQRSVSSSPIQFLALAKGPPQVGTPTIMLRCYK